MIKGKYILMLFLLKHVSRVYKFLKLYICGDEMCNLVRLKYMFKCTIK